MSEYSKLIKAYDIRGIVPGELNDTHVHDIGKAFARFVSAASGLHVVSHQHQDGDIRSGVVLARDMRHSSPQLAIGFAAGVTSQGLDVIDLGMASTDLLYFACGHLSLPGAIITASHNAAHFNGIKMCGPGASPIGAESGLQIIRELLDTDLRSAPVERHGRVYRRDLLADFAKHLRGLVDLSNIRPMKVVVDAGNGMAGLIVPATLGNTLLPALPISIVPLYFDLDGSFPHHDAHPQNEANRRDLQHAVRAHGADLGLAFDGDADRCFFVDEMGEDIPPDVIISLLAERELARHPGSAIVLNVNTSRAVSETIAAHGGIPVRERVGNTYMKATLARHRAAFGAEHSGHYYFRDFWWADSGLLAAMHVLAAISASGRPASALSTNRKRYWPSGEITRQVADPARLMTRIADLWSTSGDIDWLDGLSVTTNEGWFNMRAANTEEAIRLNVEAATERGMIQIRDRVLRDLEWSAE